MRIGIFGGTFDPPHFGHLILAAEAVDQAKLDRLLWVLTPDPPHKKGKSISPADIRIDMVEVMARQSVHFELSHVDLDRESPQYAIDTVKLLHKEYPGSDFYYLMGGDSLRDLYSWHQPDEFVDSVNGIIVYDRQGTLSEMDTILTRFPGLTNKLQILKAPLIEISGLDIRQRVKEHRVYWHFMPIEIARIIRDRKLYL